MLKAVTVALAASVTTLALGAPAVAEVQLTIREGRVTLVARDATVRQILTEWARVGQTKIVNVERIPGGPVTLQLNSVPEDQALDILLRSVSGYMAAPRLVTVGSLSRYDRILVMPTTAAPRAPVAAAPPPAFQAPQVVQAPQVPPDDDRDENDQRPAQPVAVPPAGRGPVFNTFPPPQVVNPRQQAVPTQVPGATSGVPQQQPQAPAQTPPAPTTYPSQPTAPFGGVAVPGMIVPAPPPPNQQQQPGQQQP
jgi:hypothetical protein